MSASAAEEEEDDSCPLCMEELDLIDKNFLPCPCGYRVCMYCWHHIKENLNGLCPACRKPYADDPHAFSAVDRQDIVRKHKERKLKEKQERKALERPAKQVVDRRHLHNFRVVQRNLVYLIGVPPSIALEETLRRPEYFGQYGKVAKVVIHRNHTTPHASVSVYVTYTHKEDARVCIQSVDGFWIDGHHIRASFGTTKYCNNFIRGTPCNNPDCVYLHELGEEDDRFTKEEIQAGYSKLVDPPPRDAPNTIVGGGGPSGTGRRCNEPILPPPVFERIPTHPASQPTSLQQQSQARVKDRDRGNALETNMNQSHKSEPFSPPSSHAAPQEDAALKDDDLCIPPASLSATSPPFTPMGEFDSVEERNNKRSAVPNKWNTLNGSSASLIRNHKSNETAALERKLEEPQTYTHEQTPTTESGDLSSVSSGSPSMSGLAYNGVLDHQSYAEVNTHNLAQDAPESESINGASPNTNPHTPVSLSVLFQSANLVTSSSPQPNTTPSNAPGTSSMSISSPTNPNLTSSFNGFGRCAVFPVPISAFGSQSVWGPLLSKVPGAEEDLRTNPFRNLHACFSDLFELTLPPVDAECMDPWPKPLAYYNRQPIPVQTSISHRSPSPTPAPRQITNKDPQPLGPYLQVNNNGRISPNPSLNGGFSPAPQMSYAPMPKQAQHTYAQSASFNGPSHPQAYGPNPHLLHQLPPAHTHSHMYSPQPHTLTQQLTPGHTNALSHTQQLPPAHTHAHRQHSAWDGSSEWQRPK